jgi:arginyl-tRNA synthetase
MTLKIEYQNIVINLVKDSLKKIGVNDDSIVYEVPPSKDMGNLAFPMFKYASVLKQNPAKIAQAVKDNLSENPIIEKSEVKNAYLNFFFNKNYIAKNILSKIIDKKHNYGRLDKNGQKLLIEFSSPNTNKPLHLGHCRNNVLGDAIARIFDFCGYEVTKLNLINDRGIHICKSMIAYKKFGNGTTPESEGKKSDHFVGDYYVKYAKESENNKNLEKEAQDMLLKWEQNDPETLELWKKMNKWAIDGIMQTYKKMEINFDSIEYESINYLYGKDIVNEGLKKGVFYKNEDGSIWINNEDIGLDKKVLLRSDGTSVYITQDLGTAVKRHEKYRFNEMVYVVGSEQVYHFQTLFATLKKLGFAWADKCRHLSYGMVNLPEGKMKSREGNVVDADNLIELLIKMSLDVINEKDRDLTYDEKQLVAEKIALASLKYYLLNFNTTKDIMFIPEKSISFDGNTGPYLQYTTARLNSLFNKSEKNIESYNFNNDISLNDDEENIVLHLLDFEDSVYRARENLSPVDICNFVYELARLYNKFYHDNTILKADSLKLIEFRLALSKAVDIVIKICIALLGFSPLEKM